MKSTKVASNLYLCTKHYNTWIQNMGILQDETLNAGGGIYELNFEFIGEKYRSCNHLVRQIG